VVEDSTSTRTTAVNVALRERVQDDLLRRFHASRSPGACADGSPTTVCRER
jgi:hypothetical protein